jgi:hypothetical protein
MRWFVTHKGGVPAAAHPVYGAMLAFTTDRLVQRRQTAAPPW